ncbi:LacI family DNA-binding transcriptional regulator [Brachybacterium sp. GCM10030267]|uniref:LacI family DNA-binding transcriptional regulator n=1 Tax=Brachybacterium sp. GCM10030267 TaxID=3273381 RepID=UPI0036119870
MPGRAATSADVARQAGVSRATVSYVLNERPGHALPETTRQRVLTAARDLGYVPNHSARALRGKQPPVILVILRPVPFGRNIGGILDELTALAHRHGCSLVTQHADTPDALEATLAHLRPRLALSILPLEPADLGALERLRIPVVDGWRIRGGADGQAARLQVETLAAAGRSRLAYLGVAEDELRVFEEARRAGVTDTCAQLGLPLPQTAAVTMSSTPRTGAELQRILRAWTSQPEPVDGVACYNDVWAAALLRAARDQDISVPNAVSVIGMDDEPMGAFLEPPLTTIDLDVSELSRELFARGLSLLGEEVGELGERADSDSGRFTLIERGSV